MNKRLLQNVGGEIKISRVAIRKAFPIIMFCFVFLSVVLHGSAAAQNYPTKLIRLIACASPGSGADTVARIIAHGLTPLLGQQIIVENRGGAGGNIGAEIAARAPADGYTALLVQVNHAAAIPLYANLPYDLMRDLSPVVQFVTAPMVLVVHPTMPARSLAELTKIAKEKPGSIVYGSAGIGSPTFVAGELFRMMAGVDMLHVPYKSGGEALNAILSGESNIYFAPLAVALPHIKSKRIIALAVTSAKRLPLLPDTPTIAESGYPGYEAGNWYGLMVPVKTSPEIITTLHGATIKALKTPEMTTRLADLGYIAVGDTPEEFSRHIKSQIEQLSKMLKGAQKPYKR